MFEKILDYNLTMRQLSIKSKKLLKEFSKTLKLPKEKSVNPIAIAPFGPCCVGKTTTMNQLAKKLPVVHVNHDKMRLFMWNKGIEDVNGTLYKQSLIVYLAEQYLSKGYSVIIDRDFGTNNKNVLADMDKETKKLGVKFFLIQVKAPRWFINKKILTRKLLPKEEGGIPDRETAMSRYLYSVKNYSNNYRHLKSRAMATVDTSKLITIQLRPVIKFLKKEMGI